MSEKTLNVKVEVKRLLEEWKSDDGRGIKFELDVICSEKDLDIFPEVGQKFTIHVNLTRGMEDFSFTPEPEALWKKALNEFLEYDLLQNGFDSYEGIGVGDEYQAVIDEKPI